MSVAIVITISLLILFTLLATGQYVGAAVGLTALLLLHFLVEPGKELLAIITPWSTLNNFVLLALPGFILMGNIIMHSGLGSRLYRGISPWVSRLPGGLLHTNIASCAAFGAICGSSVATAATIGTMAIPEQTKLGYDKTFILGTLAGAGTLGLMIPPSISLIVYAALTGESIGRLFIGGIIPGVMLAALFMSYTAIKSVQQPDLVPPAIATPSLKELALSLRNLWPVVVLLVGVIGSIYFGVATIIEAAALGVVGAAILAAVHRQFGWQVIRRSLSEAVRTTVMINFIVIGALVLQFAWGNLAVPRQLASAITGLGLSRWVVLAFIYLIYLGLGCLFDGISMMVLTLPIIFPLILSLGFNPLWFGVTLTLLIEIAQITPPIGLNLYVLSGMAKAPIMQVVRGAIPFFFLLLVGLLLITVFPSLITWLPGTMMGK